MEESLSLSNHSLKNIFCFIEKIKVTRDLTQAWFHRKRLAPAAFMLTHLPG